MKYLQPLLVFGLLLISQLSFGQYSEEHDKGEEQSVEKGKRLYYVSWNYNSGSHYPGRISFFKINHRKKNIWPRSYEIYLESYEGDADIVFPSDWLDYYNEYPTVTNSSTSLGIAYGEVLPFSSEKVRFTLSGGATVNIISKIVGFEFGQHEIYDAFGPTGQYYTGYKGEFKESLTAVGLEAKFTIDYAFLKIMGLTSNFRFKTVPGYWSRASMGLGIMIGKVR